MASFSYTYTDGIINTTSNPAKVTVTYTATYDETTNCTTVTISKVGHSYQSVANKGTSWYANITVTATDSSYKAKTIACYQGTSNATSLSTTASSTDGGIIVSTLIVQHSEEAGDKKITIECVSRLNYLIQSDQTSYSSKDASGSKSVTVAEGKPEFKHTNKIFIDRSHVLASTQYLPQWSQILGITIPYTSSYDPLTNRTTIKFSNATLHHSQTGFYLDGGVAISVTPVDNPTESQSLRLMMEEEEKTASAQTIGHTTVKKYSSSNTVVLQHLSTEDVERKVEVYMKPAFTFYLDASKDTSWTFDNDYTNTFISGIYETQGLVYIDNGTEFVAYQVYIDNGTSWDLYVPYIDNGTDWEICN